MTSLRAPSGAYFERLRAAMARTASQLCVGLDPDPDRIPGGVEGAYEHCSRVIRETSPHACCYKPNSAFWEQYGPDGLAALRRLREETSPEIPFLYDAKRSDVGNTMRHYARSAFEVLGMDAITVQGYQGADSLREVTHHADRGVYVVCRSSNPGAADLQHLDAGGEPLYRRVAELAAAVDENGNVGLVMGATAPSEIAEMRGETSLPFLIPGVGAQGGDLERSALAATTDDPVSCLISASRAVLYAASPGAAAAQLAGAIRAALAPV
ncbi:MAG: orotidine-5'-phosphate decarboxylase [Candidatus Dormibacteraceae bacterium]